MPQGRIVLKSISESRKLSMLKSDSARLLYTWILPHVDPGGNYSGDPTVVNRKILTRLKKSDEIVKGYLQELHDAGLIVLFEADGDQFLHVIKFTEKTPGIREDHEAPSNIPPPTEEQLRAANAKPARPPVARKAPKPEIRFTDYWEGITEEDHKAWSEAYPACDVAAELRKMAEWIKANPAKGKKKNYRRFINNWLSKRQDQGGTKGASGTIKDQVMAWAKK